jgi:single-strand DNA-binding protein
MPSENEVRITGHCGRDPELTHTPSGMAICKVTVATSKKKKDAQGNWVDGKTQWHRLVSFDKRAEWVSAYRKGDLISIVGEISYGDYERDGVKVYTTDIIINKLNSMPPQGRQPAPQSTATHVVNNQQGFKGNPSPNVPTQGGYDESDPLPF